MFFVLFGSSLMTLNHDDEESHAHWSVTLAIKVEFCLVWIFGSVENILMSLFSSECVCDGFEAKWSETLKFSPSNAMDAKSWNIFDTVSICSQFTAKQRPHWSWKTIHSQCDGCLCNGLSPWLSFKSIVARKWLKLLLLLLRVRVLHFVLFFLYWIVIVYKAKWRYKVLCRCSVQRLLESWVE